MIHQPQSTSGDTTYTNGAETQPTKPLATLHALLSSRTTMFQCSLQNMAATHSPVEPQRENSPKSLLCTALIWHLSSPAVSSMSISRRSMTMVSSQLQQTPPLAPWRISMHGLPRSRLSLHPQSRPAPTHQPTARSPAQPSMPTGKSHQADFRLLPMSPSVTAKSAP